MTPTIRRRKSTDCPHTGTALPSPLTSHIDACMQSDRTGKQAQAAQAQMAALWGAAHPQCLLHHDASLRRLILIIVVAQRPFPHDLATQQDNTLYEVSRGDTSAQSTETTIWGRELRLSRATCHSRFSSGTGRPSLDIACYQTDRVLGWRIVTIVYTAQ